jgi:hypothetical protein
MQQKYLSELAWFLGMLVEAALMVFSAGGNSKFWSQHRRLFAQRLQQ